MKQHHGWTLTEIENMIPFERDMYAAMIKETVEEREKNKPKR